TRFEYAGCPFFSATMPAYRFYREIDSVLNEALTQARALIWTYSGHSGVQEIQMTLGGDWPPGYKQVEMNLPSTLVLVNLEWPTLSREHAVLAVPKAGPSLFSCELPDACGRFVFSPANNHIMDYGIPGVESTLSLRDRRAFKACGAGKDFLEARCPIVIEDDGIQIDVIACCEAQFGVANGARAGGLNSVLGSIWQSRDLRRTVDAVTVSIHANVEDSPWPSPFTRELCRSFIDAGASVVHHAHVPQGLTNMAQV